MRQLFVDTSAYFALTDRSDENHEAAVRIIHQLIRERTELLTTNYILTQAFAFDHHFTQYGFSLLP